MNRAQIATIAILVVMVALFLWNRWRYDIVALSAGSDFLSPIGHQCNTPVMGPGGYRFGDYWKLGLPLSLLVVALGVPLIMVFWPLH